MSASRESAHIKGLLLAAIVGMILFMPGLYGLSAAQDTGPSTETPGESTRQPTKMTATGLTVRGYDLDKLILGDQKYVIAGFTAFYGLDGVRIPPRSLKSGNLVDIEYLTGGARTEAYPFGPFPKVLTTVRVVNPSATK